MEDIIRINFTIKCSIFMLQIKINILSIYYHITIQYMADVGLLKINTQKYEKKYI